MPLLKKNKVQKPPKPKKSKGKIAALIVLGIVVLAVVGGSLAYRYFGTKAYVQSVYDMNMTWVLSENSSDGIIQDAATQNIYWDATNDITACYVQKGDTVKAGDKLFQYDTESLKLQVEQAQLGLDVAKYNLQVAKQDLENTGKATIVPSAKAQEEEAKKIDEKYEADVAAAEAADATKQAEANAAYSAAHEMTYERIKGATSIDGIATFTGGDGTLATPWTYTCDDNAIISSTTVESLIDANEYVVLNGYTLGGTGDVPFTAAYRLIKDMTDFSFPTITPTVVADPKYPEYDPKGMTEDEKKEQTSFEEVDIKKAENAVKSAEINLSDAKRRLSEATVTAKIGGVILSMGDWENPPQDGSAFITISSENGLAVTGYVSELQLDSMKEGDEINISSWESGASATATVTEVSRYPASNYTSYSDGNNNVSWYPYTAVIEDAEGFKTGESVQITKSQGSVEDAIVLMKIYVRSDEKGNYVLKDNGKGRLVRQDVTVKNTSDNEYIQIIEGLTMDDMVAFPYGSKGKEGVKTTTTMSIFEMLF